MLHNPVEYMRSAGAAETLLTGVRGVDTGSPQRCEQRLIRSHTHLRRWRQPLR